MLSVVLLAFSYKSILKIGLEPKNTMFILSVAISIAGTVLFFFSLSGAVLYIISKNKKVYFKGLNIFVVKQINSKFNTNFISMSVICFMLFITILILSTGISLKKDFEASLNKIAPFDASIILYANDENNNIEEVLNKIDFKISENEKATTYNEYASAVELKELLSVEDETFEGYFGSFVKISDYNKILKLRGEKEINLKKDEVLILSNYSKLVKPINEKLENNNKVNINGKEYFVKNHEAIQDNLNDFIIEATFCTIVINDEFLPNSKVFKSVINVMYTDKNREENNKKYDQIKNSSIDGEYSSLGIADIDAHSKDSVYSGGKRVTTSELFIGLYLGIVFLITTMAVLALQQLSEASDSIERYKALKRIGASKKMINKTIFIQTLMHFTLPVIMALIHSVIGVAVVNKEIGIYNPIDIRFSALITALIFVVVYIGYFYITYTGYKNIVKNNM